MVRTVYTERTEIQPVDFTAAAGAGSEAWAKTLSGVGNEVYQVAQQKANSDAALAGIEEGLKGEEAKPWSNWTQANRIANEKMYQTQASTVSNDLATTGDRVLQQAVTEHGYGPEALNQFNHVFGAYSAATLGKVSVPLKSTVRKVAFAIKHRNETQLSKEALRQSTQYRQFNDRQNAHNSTVNMTNYVGAYGVTEDPIIRDGINDEINNNLTTFGRLNLPSATKAKIFSQYQESVTKAMINRESLNIYDKIKRVQALNPSNAADQVKVLRSRLAEFMDPEKSHKLVDQIFTNHPGLRGISRDTAAEWVVKSGTTVANQFGKMTSDAKGLVATAKNQFDNKQTLTPAMVLNLTDSRTVLNSKDQTNLDNVLEINKALTTYESDPSSKESRKLVDKALNGGYSAPVNKAIINWTKNYTKDIKTNPVGVFYKNQYMQMDRGPYTAAYGQPKTDIFFDTRRSVDYLTNLKKTNVTETQRRINNRFNADSNAFQSKAGTAPNMQVHFSSEQYQDYFQTLQHLTFPDMVANIKATYEEGGESSIDLMRGIQLIHADGITNELKQRFTEAAVIASGNTMTSKTAALDMEAIKETTAWNKSRDKSNYSILTGDVNTTFPAMADLKAAVDPSTYEAFRQVFFARQLATAEREGKDLDIDSDSVSQDFEEFLSNHGVYTSSGHNEDAYSVPGWGPQTEIGLINVHGPLRRDIALSQEQWNPRSPEHSIPLDGIHIQQLNAGLIALGPMNDAATKMFVLDAVEKRTPESRAAAYEMIKGGKWVSKDLGSVVFVDSAGRERPIHVHKMDDEPQTVFHAYEVIQIGKNNAK